MTKYKRWILLLTALTGFVVQTESLRATSLIHAGKFPKLLNTTTTSTEDPPIDGPKDDSKEVPVVKPENKINEIKYVEFNGTQVALTGIPQIDYQWDPNLPRELNGFNLSTYPFVDSMPAEEDIGFDCDEKINGFYASIKYGCQIYHHCLYGVRSDFICANFTAFDQKTFICHFASEVDCKNSYKYWHRNEDLYKATTEKPSAAAAGLAPLFDRNLYKRPAPGSQPATGGSLNFLPSRKEANANANANAAPKNNLPASSNNPPPLRNSNIGGNEDYGGGAAGVQRPGVRPLRRPYRRRRPQVDYYYYDDEYEEDFYEDRTRRRQQRPRNRRPVYDDYDNRRPDSRRPLDDDFDDYEYERRPYRSRNRSESRRNGDDRRKTEDRRFDDRRRPNTDDRKPIESRKKPQEERRSYSDDNKRQPEARKKPEEEKSPSTDRKSNRRKNNEDAVEEKRRDRNQERSEPTEKRQVIDEPGDKAEKSSSSSLFDRPRPVSKFSRPPQLNDKNKIPQKPTEKVLSAEDQKKKEEEYYEEYDDTSVVSSSSTTTPKPTRGYPPRLKSVTTTTTTKKPSTTTTTTTTTVSSTTQEVEYYDDEDYEVATPAKAIESSTKAVVTSTISKPIERSAFFTSRGRSTIDNLTPSSTTVSSSPTQDNFRLNRYKSPNEKSANEAANREIAAQKVNLPYTEELPPPKQVSTRKPLPSVSYNSKKFANQQTLFEATTTETPKSNKQSEAFTVDQRFFSRNAEQSEPDHLEEKDQKYVMRVIKRPFLPSRGGNPYKARGLQPVGPASLQLTDVNPQFSSTGSEFSPLTNENTQFNNDAKTLISHKTTLDDIYNEEFDVELNDALNPMLKPLTSSRGISGFSFSSLPNDDKDGYRAQSQRNIQTAEAPRTSTTTTTTEQPQYEYEEVEYDYV